MSPTDPPGIVFSFVYLNKREVAQLTIVNAPLPTAREYHLLDCDRLKRDSKCSRTEIDSAEAGLWPSNIGLNLRFQLECNTAHALFEQHLRRS